MAPSTFDQEEGKETEKRVHLIFKNSSPYLVDFASAHIPLTRVTVAPSGVQGRL